ncbi:MAG: M1 family aminopeptidase [Candidatus Saccharibacteria bacterium]
MRQLLFLLLVIIAPALWAQAPDPDFNDKVAFTEAQNYIKSARFVEAPDNAAFDLIHQTLNLQVDPAVNYIAGSVASTFKFLKENIHDIHFDLSSTLKVDSVYFEGKKIAFEHLNDRISITLPQSALTNALHEVTVYYQGAPAKSGFGAFVIAKHNETPVLWTLSEPYYARDWFPCKESLSDKIDSIDVVVTCPSQYRVASNGLLVADQVSGDKRTAHWKHHYPIATYLVGIAVTNYESFSDFVVAPDGRKIEILNYVNPEYLETAKTKSQEITSVMDFYNKKLITYPFANEKYGHAQFGWGGGMEHQTMSFMTNLNFEVVSHEMAHQWFGDYITIASWHDIWLNEGFATYMTGLVYETLKEGVYWPVWKNQQLTRITSQPDGSVYVSDTTDVNQIFNSRLSYSKGGYLLQMLRWEMGDEHFFQALKSYLTDPALAYGYARQQDLVRHMEQAADTSFTEFFKDWYYGQGYPIYHIKKLAALGSDGRQIIEVSQTPSNASVSFFEMHLPIRVWKDGKSKDLRLYNTAQGQKFTISESAIDSMQFDPDKWLIAKVDMTVGTEEMAREPIKIIPDTRNHILRVVLPEFNERAQLRVVDVSGRTVMQAPLKAMDSQIEVNGLQKGIYVVEVISGKESKKEKMVVGK